MNTKDLHPGLGSGALREALADLIKMHDERRLVSVAEANLRVDKAREALSLSSPIEPRSRSVQRREALQKGEPRGTREALSNLYHAVSSAGFGHDVKASKQRLADALKVAGTLLALAPSRQGAAKDSGG